MRGDRCFFYLPAPGIAPALVPLLTPDAWVVALVKPQFEAGKAEVDRGSGVISDPAMHTRVVEELQEWIAKYTPFQVRGLTESPIYGRDGNREFLFVFGMRAFPNSQNEGKLIPKMRLIT